MPQLVVNFSILLRDRFLLFCSLYSTDNSLFQCATSGWLTVIAYVLERGHACTGFNGLFGVVMSFKCPFSFCSEFSPLTWLLWGLSWTIHILRHHLCSRLLSFSWQLQVMLQTSTIDFIAFCLYKLEIQCGHPYCILFQNISYKQSTNRALGQKASQHFGYCLILSCYSIQSRCWFFTV